MGFSKGTILKPLTERFWQKVHKTNTCWEWTASKNEDGYGKIRVNGRSEKAHRVSWQLTHGCLQLPADIKVLHSCDNPACVNPNHLFLGTQSDNIADMRRKQRHAHGETSYAKITTEQAIAIINDTRSQRIIAKEYGLCQQSVSLIKRRVNWSHI